MAETKSTGLDELQAALAEFRGLTADRIADALRRRRIRGRAGTVGECPLALMMQGEHGGRFVVGPKFIIRQSGGETVKLATPDNLAAFVRAFDHGDYPMLLNVPPRCRNGKTNKKGKGSKSGKSGKTHKRKKGTERLHLARDVGRWS